MIEPEAIDSLLSFFNNPSYPVFTLSTLSFQKAGGGTTCMQVEGLSPEQKKKRRIVGGSVLGFAVVLAIILGTTLGGGGDDEGILVNASADGIIVNASADASAGGAAELEEDGVPLTTSTRTSTTPWSPRDAGPLDSGTYHVQYSNEHMLLTIVKSSAASKW